MRSIWLTICLAFAIVCGASVASAQNGLQRFESDIKPQIELKNFSYGSASALGSAGFVLNNVSMVVPGSHPATGGKATTLRIEKVTVDELDFDRMKKSAGDDMPRFAKLKLEGITGDDDLAAALAPYGVPNVPMDFTLDYRLDTATKVLTLSKLEVNLRGQARIALALVLDGISDKASEMTKGSKDDGRLRTASLDIDDTGLLAKVLPAVAKQQGTPPEALIAVAVGSIASFTPGQGPGTIKALDAIASFIGDWKQPKGPIKISIKPTKTAGLSDLDKIMEPNALTDIFGLTVEYAGTRAGAAGGGAAGGGAGSQAAAPTAPPAAGGAPQTLTGPEAWLGVAGNTVTGKIDGKTYFDLYRKDGTLTTLQEGEITSGKWTIEGEKVCLKYPDEDKDCYFVKRIGDEITMTDAKGKGLRATLLQGNPKNL